MSVLRRLESGLEALFEGAFTRIFRPRVQPAEIAHRLERELETNQVVGLGQILAPNYYQVSLHPRDYEPFERFKTALERDFSAYIQDRARAHNLTLVTKPKVEIISDPNVKPGSVHVESYLQDLGPGEIDPQLEFTQPIEVTRARPKIPASAFLTVISGPQNGQRFHLSPSGRASIGRGLDNQIILEDPMVSRHHAEIYLRGSEWYIKDLNSTNGTYVNGHAIREKALEHGDRITLGSVDIRFSLR